MFNRKYLPVALTSVLSLVTSLFVLRTPVPALIGDQFSAVEVAKHIEVISRDPHSVYDQDGVEGPHQEVHDYIVSTLGELITPAAVTQTEFSIAEVQDAVDYTVDDIDYPIKNVMATIQGTSDTGILLVAHYDSRGHVGRAGELGRSYGAADDGYGIGTMLEIARLYGQATDLKNSIYLLFTDGEEVGLYGAVMAASDAALMAKIGFVINIEARGIKGAAYMFETSTNNQKVIDFYSNAQLPVTYSLATAVYTVMPNSTDFTAFLAAGKQGVNFASLDNLNYYHTPLDNYTNIDLSTIQHYGSQIWPMVEEFVSDSIYSDVDFFIADQNKIFFTILPGVMVSYTETFANIIHFLVLAALIGLVILLTMKREISLLGLTKQFGIIMGGLVASAIAGLYISKFIAFTGSVAWSLTYTKMSAADIPALLILVGFVVFLAFAIKKWIKQKSWVELTLAGITLNIIFALATGFILSGASFLFLIPALTGIIGLWVRALVKNNVIRQVAYSQTIIWNILMIVPIVYSLYLALTVGGLLAFMVILLINASVTLPLGLIAIEKA